MDRPTERRCPICQVPFRPETSPALPFCSRRCRLIDLGRWLDEAYGLPYDPPEEDQPAVEGDASPADESG